MPGSVPMAQPDGWHVAMHVSDDSGRIGESTASLRREYRIRACEWRVPICVLYLAAHRARGPSASEKLRCPADKPEHHPQVPEHSSKAVAAAAIASG